MICADTSVWVAFFNEEQHEQVEKFEQALNQSILIMAPPVLSELISFPKIVRRDVEIISKLPLIELKEGFWQRVGESRRAVLSKGHKARLADALIAQCCIDTDTQLLAIDQDYRHYVKLGLNLL